MEQTPMYAYSGKVDGASVSFAIYADRIEVGAARKKVSGAKIAGGVMTMGLSLAATGVSKSDGSGARMLPIRSISGVTVDEAGRKKARLRVTAGIESIVVELTKDEARQACDAIQRAMFT